MWHVDLHILVANITSSLVWKAKAIVMNDINTFHNIGFEVRFNPYVKLCYGGNTPTRLISWSYPKFDPQLRQVF